MMKYVKLLGSYVGIAAAAVLLYAPWFVGLPLNPLNPSVPLLQAGASVLAGIGLAGAFVGTTVATLRTPETRLLSAAEVQEADDVRPELAAAAQQTVAGKYARQGLDQLAEMDRKHDRLAQALSASFAEGSLSYERYDAAIAQVEHTIVRNCAWLSNKVRAFDGQAYKKAQSIPRPGSNEETRSEQLALYEGNLGEMRDILAANERLLLELSRLEDELSDLGDDASRASNQDVLDEIQTLVDQAKYYRS